MKLIDLFNTILVCILFACFTTFLLSTIAGYDTASVNKGIMNIVNGPGANFK